MEWLELFSQDLHFKFRSRPRFHWHPHATIIVCLRGSRLEPSTELMRAMLACLRGSRLEPFTELVRGGLGPSALYHLELGSEASSSSDHWTRRHGLGGFKLQPCRAASATFGDTATMTTGPRLPVGRPHTRAIVTGTGRSAMQALPAAQRALSLALAGAGLSPGRGGHSEATVPVTRVTLPVTQAASRL